MLLMIQVILGSKGTGKTKLSDDERELMERFADSHDADASHVAQSSRPAAAKGKKGFFSKLKDALG